MHHIVNVDKNIPQPFALPVRIATFLKCPRSVSTLSGDGVRGAFDLEFAQAANFSAVDYFSSCACDCGLSLRSDNFSKPAPPDLETNL